MISCRSTVCFFRQWQMAQPVVSGTIGGRFNLQDQGHRCCHRPRRGDIALPSQDVKDDVAAAQLGRQYLGAGRLDGVEPGLGDRRQDIDELAIAVIMAGKPVFANKLLEFSHQGEVQ
jgi:hypothetical protein